MPAASYIQYVSCLRVYISCLTRVSCPTSFSSCKFAVVLLPFLFVCFLKLFFLLSGIYVFLNVRLYIFLHEARTLSERFLICYVCNIRTSVTIIF
jgi:hypothetical protein